MLHLLFQPPKTPFILACSGGVDSMAAADFFYRGKKKFMLAYFNHATPQANEMQEFVSFWARERDLPFLTSKCNVQKPKDQSPEEFWRNERYNWLCSFNQSVIICHHLNDVAETWIFSSLHGQSKLIASVNGLVQRPFLLTTKEEMIQWCQDHQVPWVEDQSNQNIKYPRNLIRHKILPECLKVNPGLLKVLKKKLLKRHKDLE